MTPRFLEVSIAGLFALTAALAHWTESSDPYTFLWEIKATLDGYQKRTGEFPTDFQWVLENSSLLSSLDAIHTRGYEVEVEILTPTAYGIRTRNRGDLPDYKITNNFGAPQRIFRSDAERSEMLGQLFGILASTSSREDQKAEAVMRLQSFTCKEVCETLLQVVRDGGEGDPRSMAMSVLGIVYDGRSPGIVKAVCDLLEDETNEIVIYRAVGFFERFPDVRAVPFLKRMREEWYGDEEKDDLVAQVDRILEMIRSQDRGAEER